MFSTISPFTCKDAIMVKKIFSTCKIQFDRSKSTSETESLKCIHLTQLSDLPVLRKYVIREKRKITLICNLRYPYVVDAMHRIWLLLCTLPHATLLAWWSISSFILVFSPYTTRTNFSIINGREIKELAKLSLHYAFMVSFSYICSSNLPRPIESLGKSLLKIHFIIATSSKFLDYLNCGIYLFYTLYLQWYKTCAALNYIYWCSNDCNSWLIWKCSQAIASFYKHTQISNLIPQRANSRFNRNIRKI